MVGGREQERRVRRGQHPRTKYLLGHIPRDLFLTQTSPPNVLSMRPAAETFKVHAVNTPFLAFEGHANSL